MRLSNETMNLFLAPWNIEQNMDVFELYNCKDLCSFACTDEKNAHRFVLLPELYEALTEAAVKYCPELGSNFDSCDTCSVKKCEVREWVNLLKKVKDGK